MNAPTIVAVTGGLGFIGSHLVKYLLRQDNVLVLNIDLNDYAAADASRFLVYNAEEQTLQLGPYSPVACPDKFSCGMEPELLGSNEQHVVFGHNINGVGSSIQPLSCAFRYYQPHYVLHLAAQTHVDRSIEGAGPFAATNVGGTCHALELAMLSKRLQKFVYVSTDEVYGCLTNASQELSRWSDPRLTGFQEWHPTNCGNPYAATKAGGEQLVKGFFNTHKLPGVITRGCNTFGTHQFPEKFIPLLCANAVADKPIPVYGDGRQSRQWMCVEDHATGIWSAAVCGKPGQAYNLGTGLPVPNIEVAKLALRTFKKPDSLLSFVEDRPGHDRHYWVASGLAKRELHWKPQCQFSCDRPDDLVKTFQWYNSAEGQQWLKQVGYDSTQRRGLCRRESS